MAFFDLMYCKYTVEYTYPGVKWFAVGVGTVDSSDILALYSGQNTFSSSNVRKKHSRKHLK